MDPQFRTLYREFLFRMIDRELLAGGAQGDANRLLGRFAATLIWLSFPFTVMAFAVSNRHVSRAEMLAGAWGAEHTIIATTMLIVSLFAVLSWDHVFPDRRDALVLGPLPVRARTIMTAKVAALAAALGVAVAMFNGLPGLALPFALTPPQANLMELVLSTGLYRSFIAYWFGGGRNIHALRRALGSGGGIAVAAGVVCAGDVGSTDRDVLFVAGRVLPRTIARFGARVGRTRVPAGTVVAPHLLVLGDVQQLNGSADGPARAVLATLATRAWVGLALAAACAGGAVLVGNYRTLRKVLEQPDLPPGTGRATRLPRFGGPVRTAIVQFTIRTLMRSRQHRVILAFWSGVGFAIVILFLKTPLAQKIAAMAGTDPWRQASVPVIASSFVMLAFWTLGVRIAMAMPIELKAHWTFRIVPRLSPPEATGALRAGLYATTALPLWMALAAVLLWMWPARMAAGHLAIFALTAAIAIELCLRGFVKIPFTCSFLPGISNLHITFCLCLMLGLNALYLASEFERSALSDGRKFAWLVAALGVLLAAAWWRTRRSTIGSPGLIFEEEELPEVMSLGLPSPPPTDGAKQD